MRPQINLRLTCLAVILFLSIFVYGQEAKIPDFKKVSTAAVAFVEKGNIYKSPDKGSKIISEFKFNECFIVTGFIGEKGKGWEWLRIENEDGTKRGCIQAETVMCLPTIGWKSKKPIDWVSVRYNILSQQSKNPKICEKIMNQMLKKYPKHLISTEFEDDDQVNRPLTELAPDLIARIYANSNEYKEAVQKLAQLIKTTKNDPQKKAGYYLEMLQMFNKKDYSDPVSKEFWCWKTLKDVPGVEVEGDEWNDWPDDDAALLLCNMHRLAGDEKALGVTGNKLMKVAKNFRVYILGAEAKIESLMAQKQYSAAKKLLLKTYEKYPSGISTYFKSGVNSTLLLFGAYLKGFDSVDPSHDRKMKALHELEKMPFVEPVKNFIVYQKIVTLDDGQGLLEDLNKLDLNDFGDDSTMLVSHKYFDPSRLSRIKLLSNYQSYQAVLTKDVMLSFSHDQQDQSLKVPQGTQLTVEYPDPRSEFIKVRLDDGKVGWINGTSLEKINPVPLFVSNPKANYWTMAGGNPGRSYFIPEDPIKNPVLMKTIPFFQSKEPLVVALKSGDLPVILSNDLNGVLNAIRGDGKGIAFKLTGYTTQGVPSFIADNLILTVDSANEGKWLASFSENGIENWKIRIARNGNIMRPDGAYVSGDKVYSNCISDDGSAFKCLELKTGRELWKYLYNFSTDFRPLFYKNIAVLTVENGPNYKDKIDVLQLKLQKVLWEIEKPNKSFVDWSVGSPLISNGVLLFHDIKFIQANDLLSGKILWKKPNDNIGGNLPDTNMACDGKSVYFFDGFNNQLMLKSLDLASGKSNWIKTFRMDYSNWPVGKMAVVKGALYYSIGTALVAIDTLTGNELWEVPLPGGVGSGNTPNSSVVPAAGRVVVSQGNTIYLIGEK